ncbi:unnamed protein product [Lupinus luteus]|uniref:Uncharacterized protein n=1 Tax=Lupinus luteus TaxID=3873 RepID=A0AAV1XQ58_LUPLU
MVSKSNILFRLESYHVHSKFYFVQKFNKHTLNYESECHMRAPQVQESKSDIVWAHGSAGSVYAPSELKRCVLTEN